MDHLAQQQQQQQQLHEYPSQNGVGGAHVPRHSLAEFPSPGANGTAHGQNGHGQGPMPVPPPTGNGFAGHMHRSSAMGGAGGFGISRSPPNNKNTAHVPCKFFRAGNCQAGNACPFSHAIDTLTEPAACKYFAKGNCKFGAKCANPHILPDGRDGRKFNWRAPFGSGAAGFAGRTRTPSAAQYVDPVAHAMYTAIPTPLTPSSPTMYQNGLVDEYYPSPSQSRLDGLFVAGTIYPTMTTSNYGAPPADSRLGLSPPIRALDATLPASFDSQGISHLARYGPAAASVPKTFGLGPITSTSPTTSTVTSTAFGNLNYLASGTVNGSPRSSHVASSPPTTIEDGFPRKILHSELRSLPQMITSSSLPGPRPTLRNEHFGDDSDGSEEELLRLPGALSDDLLTPSEKMRRFSRAEEDSNGFTTRQSLSGLGSPSDSKVGSPSNASPSSRYGALFARRQREESANAVEAVNSASAFGHVGSPLRKYSLPANDTAPSTSRSRSGELSAFALSTPAVPRTSAGGIGMLSQQLRNTRLNSNLNSNHSSVADSSDSGTNNIVNNLHLLGPTSAGRGRTTNKSSLATALNGNGAGAAAGRLDRAVSSGSVGRAERIDEDFVFSMEEDEGGRKEREKEKEKEKDKEKERARPWSEIAAKGSKSEIGALKHGGVGEGG